MTHSLEFKRAVSEVSAGEEQTVNDVPEEQPVNNVPEEQTLNDVPEEETVNNVPEEQTVNNVPEQQGVEVEDLNEIQCDKCTNTFTNKQSFERHVELHFYADNLSTAFHKCRICNIVVKKKDLNIQCSKCIYFFHKKCTSKKDAKGKWKSSLFICQICSPSTSTIPSISLDPTAKAFPDPVQNPSVREKLPTLSGRHRKSNLNLENPETEFLRSQVDTLKTAVSQNDEEIKKLKQSNDLKTKRIIQLESKLQEAQNCITQQAKVNKPGVINLDTDIADEETQPRVDLLEQKYSFIINQLNALSSKFSKFNSKEEQ